MGLNRLSEAFNTQARLLRDAIDGNQAAMVSLVDRLSNDVRAREAQAQERFDEALTDVFWQVGLVALAFLILIIGIGIAIASSISTPLAQLKDSMHAIVGGDYDRRVRGIDARDEIGEMARAVEVFRENAVARRRAEDELRSSKEHAESALADLRDTQKSLIEAEKLAALGGLVAGVAHEVNNPVGISLTVASALDRKTSNFTAEVARGELRRSSLNDFLETSRSASSQLVANLNRAAELIQSFKQVAADRNYSDQRTFDLGDLTEQVVMSLRPGLRKHNLTLNVECQPNLMMNSYPGPYGQVLTNLFLNSVAHAFPDGKAGTVDIQVRESGKDNVEILFSDNGCGMSLDVRRRAFDPFFTTRRDQGGTGLGLHIVYSIVTTRLGGRLDLDSEPGGGTRIQMILPRVAPLEQAAE